MTENIKIVVCGLDEAGKTTIINFLQKGDFTQTNRTLGTNLSHVSIQDLKLNIFDLGGQKMFRPDWSNQIFGANFFLYVIDASKKERFSEAKEEFLKISSQIPKECLIFFLSNKQDLEEVTSVDEIKQFFPINDHLMFETSAITGEGMDDLFEQILIGIKPSINIEISYPVPKQHLTDKIFKCVYLEAGECPTPNEVPKSCPSCIYCKCSNCLSQEPNCISLFPSFFTF